MSLNPRITDWTGRQAWVIGASSGIGLALAEALHAAGARVAVSARRTEPLQAFVRQHPGSQAQAMDVTDRGSVGAAAIALQAAGWGPWDLVLYCPGHYRAQQATPFDLADLQQHLAVNYQGALHVLDVVLPGLVAAGQGHISLVGSVAGYRGLPLSLAYGPTKAALQHLADCLYLDLRPRGLGVSIVNPGFVETPLTAQNAFAMPQLISPEQAARHMLDGWARGRFQMDFPRPFTLVMRLMRLLPDALYFPLVRRLTGHGGAAGAPARVGPHRDADA